MCNDSSLNIFYHVQNHCTQANSPNKTNIDSGVRSNQSIQTNIKNSQIDAQMELSNNDEFEHPSPLNLPTITSEIQELFKYIQYFEPHDIELETPLKCFIPEFIPAIGEMDPFIKVLISAHFHCIFIELLSFLFVFYTDSTSR